MRRLFPGVMALTFAALIGGAAEAQITLVPGLQSLVAQSPTYIAAADYNKDGFEDAVVTNSTSNKVTVLFGQDGTSFGSIVDITVGRVLRGIQAGDLNSDGNPDIAVVDFLDSRVFLVTGNGNGTFNQPVSFKVGLRPIDVGIGNFDRQKGNDLVTADQIINKVTVLLNQGLNRGFTSIGEFAVGKIPKRLEVADFNGDGFDDIIVINTGAGGTANGADDASVLINTGVGSFREPPINFVVGAGAKDVAIADYNNDGAPDLAVLNAFASNTPNEYSVTVLLNQTQVVNGKTVGTGFFDLQTPVRVACPPSINGIAILCQPNFIAAGDFDNDGFTDFAISFFTHPLNGGGSISTAGLVQAYQGHGNGSFDYSTQVSVGLNPQGLVAGDFNGDGVTDLAIAEQGSRTVRIITALPPPPQPLGQQCRFGRQCASGFCVDDVCCGTVSCPTDQFCNILGVGGTFGGVCSPPAPAGNPCTDGVQCQSGFCVDGFCCETRTCGSGEFCNSGTCGPPAGNGVPCNANEQCSSGFCTDGVCCQDDRCPVGQVCNIPDFEGQCTSTKGPGTPCTDARQCTSTFCVDNFCCDVDECPSGQSCGVHPMEGECRIVPTPTPTLTATPTPTFTPTPAPSGVSCTTGANCLSTFCVNGVCCGAASCPDNQRCDIFDSRGICKPKHSIGEQCQGDIDCLSGNCQSGSPSTCQAVRTPTPTFTATPLGIGDACSTTSQCPATFVCGTEGVCCNLATCPSGTSCRVEGHRGFCSSPPTATPSPIPTPTLPGPGVPCTSPDICASGFCTDGVCCETDQCPAGERCDILGFKGQCSPPLGVDGQCDKNTDCEEGLSCQFCSSGPPNCATAGKFLCSIPPPPTPTFISTAVPTPTTAIDVTVSRSGGCSIGDNAADSGTAWLLVGLPLIFGMRRYRLQRARAGRTIRDGR